MHLEHMRGSKSQLIILNGSPGLELQWLVCTVNSLRMLINGLQIKWRFLGKGWGVSDLLSALLIKFFCVSEVTCTRDVNEWLYCSRHAD